MKTLCDFHKSCLPGTVFRFFSKFNPNSGEYRIVQSKKGNSVKLLDANGNYTYFKFPKKKNTIFVNGIMKIFREKEETFEDAPEVIFIVQKIEDEIIQKSITAKYTAAKEPLLNMEKEN